MNSVEWDYYDKFEEITNKYMPSSGEGETKASQLVTAINKLVYKWYNDGDVYDNTYSMDGWCNDLSSYANWIYKNYPESQGILENIANIITDEEYEQILKQLADTFYKEPFLTEESKKPATGTIYKCEGAFRFEEYNEEYNEEYDEEW